MGSFHSLLAQGSDEHCLPDPLPSSCIRAGWQVHWYKVRGKALIIRVRSVYGLGKSPISSLCSGFLFAAPTMLAQVL